MLDVDLGPDDPAVRQIELRHVDVQPPLLPEAIERVVAAIVDVRDPLLDPRNAREALLPHAADLVVAIPAGAIEEADLRIEARADLDHPRGVVPVLRLIADARAVRPLVAARP